MPRERTATVNAVASGGTVWNCQEDGCGRHPNENGQATATSPRMLYATPAERDQHFDATFELGVPATAAGPAVAPKRKAS